MGVNNNFYIKVDDNDFYSASGTFKNIGTINTHNGKTFPLNNSLGNLRHTVLGKIDSNCNAFNNITSSQSNYFKNDTYGAISFQSVGDRLSDIVQPICSGKLYKSNVDYPLMHPKMMSVLDYFSKSSYTPTSISAGIYYINCYGDVNGGALRGTGVFEIQAGGGGSGGANSSGSDSAGGGGGSGGFATVYYRVKTKNTVTLQITVGAGGTAGASGSGYGGAGGNSKLDFYVNENGTTKGYYVHAVGGSGGQGGDNNYNSGGDGGRVVYYDGSTYTELVSGGVGGLESRSPTSGQHSIWTPSWTVVDNDYLIVAVRSVLGGSGGGRGDDTDGTDSAGLGQAGAGSTTGTYSMPFVFNSTAVSKTIGGKSGGSKGAGVSDASSGGGGASALSNGGAGGNESSSGNNGSLGSGAGGAGVGNNANRGGSTGGAGIVRYWL